MTKVQKLYEQTESLRRKEEFLKYLNTTKLMVSSIFSLVCKNFYEKLRISP